LYTELDVIKMYEASDLTSHSLFHTPAGTFCTAYYTVHDTYCSFAQYIVLDWSMKRGQMDFVEKVGAEGETIVVKRDPRYSNNKLLPEIHSRMVGDRILE
jgi:hypothetical protein